MYAIIMQIMLIPSIGALFMQFIRYWYIWIFTLSSEMTTGFFTMVMLYLWEKNNHSAFFSTYKTKSFSWKNYTHKLQDGNLNGKKNRVSFVIIIPFMWNYDNLNG